MHRTAKNTIQHQQGGRPIRAALFDLDGTLGNTLEYLIAVQIELLGDMLGREITRADLLQGFGLTERGGMRLICPKIADEAYDRYVEQMALQHAARCPKPIDGIPELLEDLQTHGIRLGVISGRGIESLRVTLDAFGLTKYFSYIGGGDDVREVKHERVLEALRQFGLTVDDAVYVGDAVNDIRFSHSIGLRVISVTYAGIAERSALLAEHPEWTCDSVELLKHTLQMLCEG